MKTSCFSLLILLLLNFSPIYAQEFDRNQCGLDSAYALNADEAAYFNEILSDQRDNFDFEGKNIAFASGNSGHFVSNKFRYFRSEAKARYKDGNLVVNQLLVLTEAERKTLPHIDAIVVSWSKVRVQDKKRDKLILLLSDRI